MNRLNELDVLLSEVLLTSKDANSEQLSGMINTVTSILFRFGADHPRYDTLRDMKGYNSHFQNPNIMGFNPCRDFFHLKNAFITEVENLIEEIHTIGFPNISKTSPQISISNQNHQTQEQNQTTSLSFDIFVEAIKDEITGRELKELKDICSEENDTNNLKTKK